MSPVGRLDLDTSGLLILTNDTQFAERLTNPDHKVVKTYLAKCAGPLTEEALEQLRRGVELSDGPTRPAEVRRVRDAGKYSHIEIRISEGRNRQVRRMVEAVGSKVVKLVRTGIGAVGIGELKIGEWRELTAWEIEAAGGLQRAGRNSAMIGACLKSLKTFSHGGTESCRCT